MKNYRLKIFFKYVMATNNRPSNSKWLRTWGELEIIIIITTKTKQSFTKKQKLLIKKGKKQSREIKYFNKFKHSFNFLILRN